MKVDFCVDVFRGQTAGFIANQWPNSFVGKAPGFKRVKFTVDIPMEKLFAPDIDLGEIDPATVEVSA